MEVACYYYHLPPAPPPPSSLGEVHLPIKEEEDLLSMHHLMTFKLKIVKSVIFFNPNGDVNMKVLN
eukprot:scaffold1192_cov179-Ochromonas_danica.AAC.10